MLPRRAPALLLTLMTACALPGRPYPSPDPPPDLALQPSIAITEGQPRGLLLDLRLPEDPEARAACQKLALLRQRGQGPADFEIHYTFDRAEPSPLWQEGRVAFLDRDLTPGTTYRYAVAVAIEGEPTRTSTPETIEWTEPPAPPAGLAIQAIGAHMILRWETREGEEAVIFRRKVGAKGTLRLATTTPRDEGAYVDANIEPGGVYAYMVSAVRQQGPHPLIGPPCAEVYASAQRTGPLTDPIPDPPDIKKDTE